MTPSIKGQENKLSHPNLPKESNVNQNFHKSINEEDITLLVRKFYAKVLKDPLLAPFFIKILGENIHNTLWEEHLALLIDFWKFIALGYNEYKGNPLQPHLLIEGLSRKEFTQWLYIFHQTVNTIYMPSSGIYFKNKSTDIAENFMRKLSL